MPVDARSFKGFGGADYKYGFSYPSRAVSQAGKGLSEDIIRSISASKREPRWMLEFRLDALRIFERLPMPEWGVDLSGVDFSGFRYYSKPTEEVRRSWDELPGDIKETYERLGLPEAEREFLAGVGAQYDSEIVYNRLRDELRDRGVVFVEIEAGLRDFEELFRSRFATVVPPDDNKFAALNSAAWSGGSFVYVPKGVRVDIPVQAYFRINSRSLGQFERTLIIADEGSFVHYIEGCTAPIYSEDALHSGVIEIIALPGSRVRYSTIQNWSSDVLNLVTQRAVAYAGATVEWVDGNIGSRKTMKYPTVVLAGEGAHGEVLSLAFAGKGQEQDTGGRIIHAASNTSGVITSKSISMDGGRSVFRGAVIVEPGLSGIRCKEECDALILDERSSSDTFPNIDVRGEATSIEHEAKVSKISEDQLFYLECRGIPEDEAAKMVVAGFIEPLVKELPMEYAVELNRLIELEMEGSVG